MRHSQQHFPSLRNISNPHHLFLLQNLQKSKQQTSSICHSGFQKLQHLMQQKNQSTQKLWNVYQLGIYRTDYLMNKVKEQVDILDKQLIKIQVSIKLKKLMKEYKLKELNQMRQLNKYCKQIQGEMVLQFNKSIQEVNEREVRKNQILMKINHNKNNNNNVSKNNINQVTKITLDRRIFKSNRLSDWLSNNTNQKDLAYKQIQINSDKEQVIFRVESQKLYDFVLVWNQEDDKFILKNPYEKLNAADLLAVKTFNVHEDPIRLLADFRKLVERNQSHL